MMLGLAAAAGGAWALRHLAHRAILRGLRAPRLPHAQGPADHGFTADQAQALTLPGPGGRPLFAWLVLPPGASAAQPVPAVLVMHGWGANAAVMWPVVPPLHAAGLAVLLLDARCHGRSGDEAFTSMPRFAEDIAAGLAWLRRQPAIDGGRLALLGHSVGAAAALLHASHHHADVRAVVSLSAFAHPREVMRRLLAHHRLPYPVLGWYVLRHVQRVIGTGFDDIAPLSTLPRVRCPTLLVHGRQDRVVPVHDARRLRAAAPRARLLLVSGDHDLRDALAPHAGTLTGFLRDALGPPEAARNPARAGRAWHWSEPGSVHPIHPLRKP